MLDLLQTILAALWLCPIAFQFTPQCCCGTIDFPCINCQSGTVPVQVEVYFQNVNSASRSCADCDDINDVVFVLDFQPADFFSEPCEWRGAFEGGTCGYSLIRARVLNVSGDYQLWVTIDEFVDFSPDETGTHSFGASAPDCCSWSELEVAETWGTEEGVCNWSDVSMAAYVTSIEPCETR